jgi:hypothetical protein
LFSIVAVLIYISANSIYKFFFLDTFFNNQK